MKLSEFEIRYLKLSRGDRREACGYTILELIVVVAMVITLIALAIPITSHYVNRAKKAKCLSHLRTIHSGISAYILEVGHWPQRVKGKGDFDEEKFYEFWIKSTEPYGLNQDTWLCPSDRALERKLDSPDKPEYWGSYVPTSFDSAPATPFRWNQPWVIERAGFHGNGPHVLMPDGSIHESFDPFAGR